MASCTAGGRAVAYHRQQTTSASLAQCRPVQLTSTRLCSSSGSSNSSSSCCSSSSSSSSRTANRTQIQALSSSNEPGSLRSSLEEVSTSTSEDYGYMQEYAALKQQLLDNTRKSGGAIGAYLLLTVNGTAALLAMLGAGASYAYLSLLCRDVDAVQPTDTVPMWEANKIENVWLRRAAKLSAAYQKALQPRLLVPVGLGCVVGLWGKLSGEPTPLLYSGCLLLGFLSYKVALVTKLVSDLTPKSFMGEAERPKIEKIDDELDQWGRPKKKLANPIDVMPEDMQDKAYKQLEEQLAREESRMQD